MVYRLLLDPSIAWSVMNLVWYPPLRIEEEGSGDIRRVMLCTNIPDTLYLRKARLAFLYKKMAKYIIDSAIITFHLHERFFLHMSPDPSSSMRRGGYQTTMNQATRGYQTYQVLFDESNI